MTAGFHPDLRDKLLKDLNLIEEAIFVMEEEYREKQPYIPGAPPIEQLTIEDMVPLASINNIALDNGETWDVFKKRKLAEHQSEVDIFNPFLPHWQSKTEDRLNVWATDCGGAAFSDMGKTKLINVIRMASPVLNKDVGELIGTYPTTDAMMLDEILNFCLKIKKLFIWSMGDGDSANFRWGPSLCLLMGMGERAVRMFAEHLGDYGDWQHWATCPTQQLVADVLDSHKITAYPVGLFRADFDKVSNILESEIRLDYAPKWYKPLTALHIAKHCRYYPNYNGSPAVFCAYQGRHSLAPIDSDNVNQPLSAGASQALRATICSVLRLPITMKKGKGANNACERAVMDVLSYITPHQLPRGRDIKTLIDLIPAKGVAIGTSSEMYNEHRWIDPGITVRNVAHIDTDSGTVNKDAIISGPTAIAIEWPRSELPLPALLKWRSIIPDEVKPELPSAILRRYIRNLNDLGHPEGFDAFLNSAMLLDLVRDEIAGTSIGNSILNEFPLIMVMPTAATEEETTNQGKTTVAKMIGQTMVPDLEPVLFNRSNSAPAQRPMAQSIEQHGAAIYDEFILPQAHDHFLNQAGIQGFATGSANTPGRAQENASPLRLKHPLLFSTKVANFPADIMNRMLPVFLDALTDETRATDAEQDALNSGRVPLLMRFSAIMWIKKNGFVEAVKKLTPMSGLLRFKGHQSVCTMLLGGNREKLEAYLKAANEQCVSQREAADDSGLADSIGVNPAFNPEFYFNNCEETTLDQLYLIFVKKTQSDKKPMLTRDVLIPMVEDGGKRQFKREIESYHLKEPAALAKFSKMLKAKPFKRGHYEMTIKISDKNVLDERGRPQTYIIITKDSKKDDTGSTDSPSAKV